MKKYLEKSVQIKKKSRPVLLKTFELVQTSSTKSVQDEITDLE